jgi:hypothetical protein
MKVYAAQFCSCIFESAYYTLSVHSTKLGAYRAVRDSKLLEWDRWSDPEVLGWKRWTIKEYEVQTP